MHRLILAIPLAMGVMLSVAPLASANPADDTATPRATQFDNSTRDWRRPCRPEHVGQRWTWHDTRRGGHWDRTGANSAVRHLWWDDTYCAARVSRRDRDRDRNSATPFGADRDRRDARATRDDRDSRDNRDRDRDDRGDRTRDRNRDRVADRDTRIDRLSLESIREQVRSQI